MKVVEQDLRHEAVQFYLLNLEKRDFERLIYSNENTVVAHSCRVVLARSFSGVLQQSRGRCFYIEESNRGDSREPPNGRVTRGLRRATVTEYRGKGL